MKALDLDYWKTRAFDAERERDAFISKHTEAVHIAERHIRGREEAAEEIARLRDRVKALEEHRKQWRRIAHRALDWLRSFDRELADEIVRDTPRATSVQGAKEKP